MIPPMPPTMPPWPGNKPPWEAIRELEAKRAREQEEAAAREAAAKEAAAREAEQRARQQAQQQQFQSWIAGGPRPGAMPIIVHGLLPPQMIQHTMPLWVGPSLMLPGMQQAPAGHQPQPQPHVQQAPPQQVQAQRPPARDDGSTTTIVPQGPGQPPLRVERSAPEQEQGTQLHPVMPVQSVFNVGLPTGARSRRF